MTAKEKRHEGKMPASSETAEKKGVGKEEEDTASTAAKGGKHSHTNDPHPAKQSSDVIAEDDPVGAARKGGQHSHTGGDE
jgi:hypothetical protein